MFENRKWEFIFPHTVRTELSLNKGVLLQGISGGSTQTWCSGLPSSERRLKWMFRSHALFILFIYDSHLLQSHLHTFIFMCYLKMRWMQSRPPSSTVVPPRFPAWYGLMRIWRAAGLVMLVNSWARLGSGSKPFLLLRIWRKTHRLDVKRLRVCVQSVFWSRH